MGVSAFNQKALVEIDGRAFCLLRKVTDSLWQLEDIRTGRISEYSDAQLRIMYEKGQLVFSNGDAKSPSPGSKTFRDISPEALELAKMRRAYVLAVQDLPNTESTFKRAIHETWKRLHKPKSPPNWTTVYRWKTRLQRSGNDITSLVEEIFKKGNRKRRYPDELLAIIEEAVDSCYLTRERKSIQDTLDYAQARVYRENMLRVPEMLLPIPTRKMITTAIRTIPAFERYAARYGQIAATKRFRAVLGHRITGAPLERAEMDHTLLDLFVIDDATGMPLGRPWITACIDSHTRCFLGIHIGFEPPSYLTVSHCLKHAFLPKTTLRDTYPSIKNSWDAHGVMRELVVDNGLEFHSKSLEEVCLSLGIEIHYSARKTPWFKGIIERGLGSLNAGVAHGNPGTTFKNIFEKDDYNPAKHAVIRLNKLLEIVNVWIVDYYHQKPHRTLKMPPAVLWVSGIRPEDILVPDDPARLDAIMGRAEQRVLTHKGIELDGLFYNSPELVELRRKRGDRLDVELRVDDMNLGKITVLSPDRKYMYVVPALSLEYASGLTRFQHRICKKYAARELGKYDPRSWIEAKNTIRCLINDELQFGKKKSHKKVARFTGGKPFDAVDARMPEQPPASLPRPRNLDENLPAMPSGKKRFKFIHRDRHQTEFDTDHEAPHE